MSRITLVLIALLFGVVMTGNCPDKCSHPKTKNECKECGRQIVATTVTIGSKQYKFNKVANQGDLALWEQRSNGKGKCWLFLNREWGPSTTAVKECNAVRKDLLGQCPGYNHELSGPICDRKIGGSCGCYVQYKLI